MLGERVINDIFSGFFVIGQCNEFFWASVALATLVVHDALAKSGIRNFLLTGVKCGVDVQATCVGFVSILRVNQLASHFGHVIGIHSVAVAGVAKLEWLITCNTCLFSGDEAVLCHALNDVELSNTGSLGIADGVVGRRCLWQACKHGRLSDSDIFQRFAEIHLTCCRKTIGTMSKKNLVHIDFQNFLFG